MVGRMLQRCFIQDASVMLFQNRRKDGRRPSAAIREHRPPLRAQGILRPQGHRLELRELGASDPEAVRRYVKSRKLSPLSEREALRKL